MSDANGGVAPGTDGGTNAAEQKQDQPKPLTMADLEALFTERLPKVVNSAVTSHMGRLKKDLDKQLEAFKPKPAAEAAEGAGDGDAEEHEAEQAKPAAKPKAEQSAKPESAKSDDKPVKVDDDPRLAALQKQLAEQNKRLAKQEKEAEEARKRADEERRARIEASGYEKIRKELTGKVIAESIDDVIDLFRTRGQVTIADDGDVRMKFGAPDEPEDGHDVESGVAAFLKTKKA